MSRGRTSPGAERRRAGHLRGSRLTTLVVGALVALVVTPAAVLANPDSPPEDLWRPPAGATPDGGTYVYLDSADGDYIGAGRQYLYTLDDAVLEVAHDSGVVTVRVEGDEWWSGRFSGPDDMVYLEPGYYGDLQRYPFHDPAAGGLSWSGEGRGCNRLHGWFVVDEIVFEHTEMTRLRLRFEQQCEGEGAPPLHGQISYDADDTGSPANPRPVPDGLWRPSAGETPGTDSYVYLDSAPGDYIGGGSTYTYTPDETTVTVSHVQGRIHVDIEGEDRWSGRFAGPDDMTYLEVGYYGDLQRYPFHNPVEGGLSWYGNGRGCNRLHGWFVVDDLSFTDGALSSLLLRFEQHCESEGAPPLHGEIRWRSTADHAPPGSGGPPPYSDIEDSPHRDAIVAVTDAGIVSGYDDGTFRPDRPVTRAQMATFLARALELPPPDDGAPRFSDTAGSPHEDAIRAVAQAGIALGYDDGSYRPHRSVRRDQMASFLARGFDLPPPDADAPTYPDTVGNTHEEAIRSVADAGIARGYPDGSYRPARSVTRGQMATFLARALGLA